MVSQPQNPEFRKNPTKLKVKNLNGQLNLDKLKLSQISLSNLLI